MKRADSKLFLPLIAAWAAGETIQCRYDTDNVWRDITGNCAFSRPPDYYRIKPKEPRTFYVIEYQNKPAPLGAVGRVVYADEATAEAQVKIFANHGYQTKLTVVKEVLE